MIAPIPRCRLTVAAAVVWSIAALGADGCAGGPGDSSYQAARTRMVDQQIVARGVVDPRVLEAMRKVPRHLFVPVEHRLYAYTDGPLPIGEDQTISQPYIVALMTELLDLQGSEKVLEIGTGSGYQAAVLGELAAKVYTIEIVESLGRRAAKLLDSLGYENIEVLIGDGYAGWPEAAPFDAIMLTAAPRTIPQPLLDQLADGGLLVAPVGEGYQTLQLVEKVGGRLKYHDILPVRFVPMTGAAEREGE
ncbi:MAG: protein-L-isoaspartate(D-aspartate) O-methyltransferase [Candidatus Zixiibacteriota bacterium]